MTNEKKTNRFEVALTDPYPIFTPSPGAIEQIEELEMQSLVSGSRDQKHFELIYDLLVEDQATYGLRIHKGYPLYWNAELVGPSDRQKSLELMLGAYVEDVLTHGHRASQGFAASSLKYDFGISVEALISLKEYVMDKTKATFFPLSMVKEFFLSYKGEAKTKQSFAGVSEQSAYEAVTLQAREKIKSDLRPSFKTPPASEDAVQTVVFALLRQVDPNVEREKKGPRLADKEYTIDFSLYQNNVGVEVKLIKDKAQLGSLIDQINADIPPYIHFFKKIIFVVYDACGAISDPNKLAASLKSGKSEIEILIV